MARWISRPRHLTRSSFERSPNGSALTFLLCLVALGCGDDTSRMSVPPDSTPDAAVDAAVLELTQPEAWTAAEVPHPWSVDGSGCEPIWIVEEYDGLRVAEIDTRECGHQTLVQPLETRLTPGTRLTIVGFHFALTAPRAATGHFVIGLGETVLVDEEFVIPGAAGGFERIIELTEDVPAGTPIYWHIRNHGANRWILVSFQAVKSSLRLGD